VAYRRGTINIQQKEEAIKLEKLRMMQTTKLNMTIAVVKNLELQDKNNGKKKKQLQIEGKSLCLFKVDNPIRQGCYKMVSWEHFDNVILVFIAISTFLLAYENPNEDPNSKKN